MARPLRLLWLTRLHSSSHGKNAIAAARNPSPFNYVYYFVIFTTTYSFQVMVLLAYSNLYFDSCGEKQNAAPDHSTSYLPAALRLAGDFLDSVMRTTQNQESTCCGRQLRAGCPSHDVISLNNRRYSLSGIAVFHPLFHSHYLSRRFH